MIATKRPARKTSAELALAGGARTGLSVAYLKQSFLDNLFCALGRSPLAATRHDTDVALALTIRDRVLKQFVRTLETYAKDDAQSAIIVSGCGV